MKKLKQLYMKDFFRQNEKFVFAVQYVYTSTVYVCLAFAFWDQVCIPGS